mgnify:CR=1 FL=1
MTPLEALQSTLAGEHAAVYVYGVLGGRVSASAEPALSTALRAAHDVHRVRRDQVTAMVRAVGEDPVAAAVGYELPNAADTARRCRRAAALLEEAVRLDRQGRIRFVHTGLLLEHALRPILEALVDAG